MRFIHWLTYGIVALLLMLHLSPPVLLHAMPTQGWFNSTQPVVAPLQPVTVNVAIPTYTGPAALLTFDSTGRAVGTWEFDVVNGAASVQVTPRGALGNHWAALFASGLQVADGTIYRLDASTIVQTGQEAFDHLYPRVAGFMANAHLGYYLDGHYIEGYRSPDSPLLWLRDHYYQGRAFCYFDSNVTSLLDAFRREQASNGSLPDFLARPDWHIQSFRTPVEADVEYLFVQAIYEAWQMTGDDQWLISMLPAMQRAVNYTLTDPLRWEPTLGLVKRPFTIDTWDFEYGPSTIDPGTGQAAPRHWIDEHTKWGIFHGDNTGLAQALTSLATIESYLGQPENAQYHRDMAAAIMARLNALSWNGSFYTHHVKLIPYDVPGVDEAQQLSLSNAIALNRNVLTIDQAQSIINAYRTRIRQRNNVAFAEWWSIDPPFPAGSFGLAGRLGERPGEYVNGGVMPLVGGELARGAFRYGFEDYGFDILERYYRLIASSNASFLWYYPTGGPGIGSPNTIPTDGWGAGAMVAALIGGAAGIEDIGIRYSEVIISPRWTAAKNVTDAYVVARYAASDGYVAYRWQHAQDRGKTYLRIEATGSGQLLHVRLMLPPDTKSVKEVILNGQPVPIVLDTVGTSQYVTLTAPADITQVQVEVRTR